MKIRAYNLAVAFVSLAAAMDSLWAGRKLC
jgi:hypothetical protein